MLKWAVNQPRPSYLELHPGKTPLPTPLNTPATSPTPTPLPRSKLRRHSLLPQLTGEGKENHVHSHSHSTLTSTPLPAAATRRSPLLRDLSNIMSPLQSPCATPTASSVPRRSQLKLKPAVYASTLPTFEAEYSPSYRPSGSNELVPGPLLALRGVGIPDSYFEKPRYLEQKSLPAAAAAAVPPPPGEATLRSSQMGDVTLERMIDAILESTRKPPTAPMGVRNRRRSRNRAAAAAGAAHPAQRRPISPSYRPAFDPASDLCEYWQSADPDPTAHATPTLSLSDGYEEREVRSPQFPPGSGQSKRRSLQLRRQRVVRRKRKIATKISSSVRQSAQKLLAAASRSAQKLPHPVARPSLMQPRHISPDSGHNSTSDFDEDLGPFGAVGAACLMDAATKRRLSFSFHEELFVE